MSVFQEKNKMFKKRLCLLLALLSASTVLVFGESEKGLLFEVSFDSGFDSDYSVGAKEAVAKGQVKTVSGMKGKGALIMSEDKSLVSLSYKAMNNFNPSKGTVSFWLNPTWDTSIVRAPSLFKVGGVIEIYYEPTVPAIVIMHNRVDGPLFATSATHKLSAGQWVNIVYAWDSQKDGKLYINTKLATQTDSSWQAPSLLESSVISLELTNDLGGREKLYPLGGVVDELKIFNRELSAEEIVEEFKRCGGQTGSVFNFEMLTDFDTTVKFNKLTWEAKDNTKVKVSTITGQTDTFATFSTWGGPSKSKWSSPAELEEDGTIKSPEGRYLKLKFMVRSEKNPEQLPIKNLAVSYTPVYSCEKECKRILKACDATLPESVNHIPLTTDVETPHEKWAKPYYRGKTKALILTHLHNQREIIELGQRMDLEFDTASVTKYAWLLSVASRYRTGLSWNNVLGKLADDLKTNNYEVIVIGGVPWKRLFNDEVRNLVLEQVKNGAGLIVILDHEDMTVELENALPLKDIKLSDLKNAPEFNTGLIGEFKDSWQKGKAHFISTGIPFEFLPEVYYFKYLKEDGEVIARTNGDPLVALGSHGKGRVVQMTYSTSKCWSGNRALTPHVLYSDSNFKYWEYYLSMLAKSILWAGNKEPDLLINELTPDGLSLSAQSANKKRIRLVLENKGLTKKVKAELTLRDEHWQSISCDNKQINCAQNAATDVDFSIPEGLMGGKYFADIIIKDDRDRVLNWGSAYFSVIADVQIVETTFDKEVYKSNESVTAKVKLKTTSQKQQNVSLKIKLFDTYNRLLKKVDSNITVAPDSNELSITLGNVESITPYVKTELELWQNDNKLSRKTEYFLTRQKWAWDDYCSVIWSDFAATSVLEYLRPYYFDKIKEMGFKAVMDECRCFNDFHFYSKNNLRIFPINFFGLVFDPDHVQKEYTRTKEKSVLTRKPCLHDESFLQGSKRNVAKLVKPLRDLNPIGYILADETSLTRCGVSTFPTTGVDVCFSSDTLKAFRLWLKTQYENLDQLNSQWETNFKCWDDVTPSTKEELLAQKTNNFSSWADHRTFMEISFANTYYNCAIEELQRTDPDVPVGLCGTGPPATYTGFDYSRLGPMLDTMWMYYNGSAGELWRSFNPNAYYTSCQGYGQSKIQRKEGLWSPLLHKHKGTLQWTLPIFINPDLSLSSHGKDLKVWFKEINSGLGKILLEAKMQTDPIAIHYSQPSMQAAWITGAGESDVEVARFEELYAMKIERGWISGNEVKHLDNMEVYCNLLEASGLQYNFVSSSQIQASELSKKNYKVLILPWSMAISTSEAERIKEFVKQGGLLIADVMPGIMDNHCKTLDKGILDDVLGVKTSGYRPVDIKGTVSCPEKVFGNLPLSNTLSNITTGPQVIATTAKNLTGFSGDNNKRKVVYVNKYGKGTAILLNFLFSNLNDNYTWANQSALLAHILDNNGIKPRVKITSDSTFIPYYEPILYRQGDNIQYLGVQRKRMGGENIEQINIQLSQKKHIYDIRSHKYIGFSDSIATSIPVGEAALFALYPYEVKGINLKVPKQCQSGEKLDYDIQIKTSRAYPGDHVVRIEVYDPQGRLAEHYSSNRLTKAGALTISLPLALNDSIGQWRLKVTEVASGISSEKTFVCKL